MSLPLSKLFLGKLSANIYIRRRPRKNEAAGLAMILRQKEQGTKKLIEKGSHGPRHRGIREAAEAVDEKGTKGDRSEGNVKTLNHRR